MRRKATEISERKWRAMDGETEEELVSALERLFEEYNPDYRVVRSEIVDIDRLSSGTILYEVLITGRRRDVA